MPPNTPYGQAPRQPQSSYPSQPNGYPSPPSSDPAQQSDYSFIMNPEQPKRKRVLPGGGSLLGRVVIASLGIIMLIIIFSVVRGLVGGGSNLPEFIGIAQSQQELIHIVTNAQEQKDLSVENKNFAVTAQLGLTTAQGDMLSYLANNKKKINPKTLNLKVSSSVDEQLAAAGESGTYNKTFKEVMQTKLNSYLQELKQTFAHSKGPKGRELLSKDYDDAQLLLQQLNAPTN